MSTKYFGEFLVSKKIISAEALVKALVSQVSTLPPVCEIVHDRQMLSPDKILTAFKYQQDNSCDFVFSCKALGLWNEELQKNVNNELGKSRKPLGEILVSQGFLDLKKLTLMLDEFLTQVDMPIVEKEEVPSVVVEEVEPQLESSADDEFLEYQAGILMELEHVFDERKRKVIKVAMSFIKDKAPPDEAGIHKLFQDSLKIVHTINGLLKLFGIQNLGQLMFYLENVIEEHLKSKPSIETHQKIAGIVYGAMELGWDLRCSIMETNSEKAFFATSANNDKFYMTINDLMNSIGNS